MTETEHYFTLNMKEWPRETTRAEYKVMARWLRVLRNKIEEVLPLEKAVDRMTEMALYGTTFFTPENRELVEELWEQENE